MLCHIWFHLSYGVQVFSHKHMSAKHMVLMCLSKITVHEGKPHGSSHCESKCATLNLHTGLLISTYNEFEITFK